MYAHHMTLVRTAMIRGEAGVDHEVLKDYRVLAEEKI
jgi:hypothetical protein